MRVVVSFCARSAVAMGCAVGAMTHSEQELAGQLIRLAVAPLRVGCEYLVNWSPSRHDQQEPGCASVPVPGRLIVAQVQRPGFRPQRLLLFTTLLEAATYPADR